VLLNKSDSVSVTRVQEPAGGTVFHVQVCLNFKVKVRQYPCAAKYICLRKTEARRGASKTMKAESKMKNRPTKEDVTLTLLANMFESV
jgi:hypothetical protein